jgi:ABC-type uncharacterized transport system ATPase subunit
MTTIALGATEIRKSYGSVRANQGISLSVGPGEIHAIVGENGAGKSTLMRVLQGIERPDSGHVTVMDRDVSFSGPADALAEGIGMVHQEFMLAPDLSLLENLVLGDEPLRWGRGAFALIDWQSAEAQGRGLAERIGIEVDWHRRAGAAPVHIQQFVEIIRLLRRGTKILILDEPTAVLAPQQVNELFDLVRRIREDGTAILFISHKIGEVMALADRVTVIRQGKIAFSAAVAQTSGEEIASHIVDGSNPVAGEIRRGTPGRGGSRRCRVVGRGCREIPSAPQHLVCLAFGRDCRTCRCCRKWSGRIDGSAVRSEAGLGPCRAGRH